MDLTVRNAILPGSPGVLTDIGVDGGRIAALSKGLPPGERDLDAAGRLVVPGFVEAHIHLDKARIADRCVIVRGDLAEAIELVAKAKGAFDEDDVAERASRVLQKSILNGAARMRAHLEVDPAIGLKGVRGVLRAIERYKRAIDVEICVFPQEGLLNYPGVEELLLEALDKGARVLGGAPYTDSDPHGQVDRLFAIARDMDRDLDLHLDFDLDPSSMDLDYVCEQTAKHGWEGRVNAGHVTKLSALTPDRLLDMGRKMRDAGVSLTVMPATDMFLMGRAFDHNVPRGIAPAHKLMELGVNCAISTNNVLNPFTPYGDCSLMRLANMYANVCQIGDAGGLANCLDMITGSAAKVIGCKDYGFEIGAPGDMVVLDACDPAGAVAEIAQPLFGFKAGRPTFSREPAVLHQD